jgi:hypothetical protein
MAKGSENIELRSEKVRSIIGQIPPKLMRIGISVIFLVFTGVLIGTYFFQYDYTIKTSAILTRQGDSIIVQIKTPVNESNRIRKGQKLILDFNNIPNMYGQRIITSISNISSTIQVTEKGGYYISACYLPENIETEKGNKLEINGTFMVEAEIQTGKIRFFDRIFEPIREIFKQRK